MSFILDALKKAERDRLREDPKNWMILLVRIGIHMKKRLQP